MSARLFAIRPEPGLSATRAAARAMGMEIFGAPLFEVHAVPWDAPDPDTFDGILLGSANVLRHGGIGLERLLIRPAYAVGAATADAARAAGFTVAAVGGGGLQGVLDSLAGQRLRLLRLAGREHVRLVPPDGIAMETRVVYESEPLPMPDELAQHLRQDSVVLLHSAAAARHFAHECDRLEIPRAGLALAAMGPRIAQAAGRGWSDVRSAESPREVDLLAMARDMCH